jgi:CubicO group peptidase (beta-lactamase class C family)
MTWPFICNFFSTPNRFAAAGVLGEQSVQTMFQPSFSNAPGFGTIYHGFFQFPFPGSQLAIGHDGDTRYQHSVMLIVPALDLGIFVAANTDGEARLVEQLPYLLGMYLEGRQQRPEILSTPGIGINIDVGGAYRCLASPLLSH